MSILPDVLAPDLKIVFCGTGIGRRSALLGQYYAGRGNLFWPVLHRVGLTPRLLASAECGTVLQYGIGLTNLAPDAVGSDSGIPASSYDVAGLRARIERYAPAILAFVGKRGAQVFLGRPVTYGRQPETIGRTAVFVLPSTSGAARGFWDEAPWRALAAL